MRIQEVAGIFHATSTPYKRRDLCRLTMINDIGFLLGLREGVVCVQALEGGCSIGEIKRNGD
jgi:hypothetical protein